MTSKTDFTDEDWAWLKRARFPAVSTWLYRGHVIDDAVIREAGRRLAAAASSPARVVLFGSHARGVAGPHSDLDFLVVEPDVDDELEEAVRLRRSLRGLGVPADVIVVSRERADAWRHVTGTFLHAALAEGRVLEDDA